MEIRVSACYCTSPIQFEGSPLCQGPQICGVDGGAPAWVGEILSKHPEIDSIAVNTENRGVIYFRIDK